MATRLVRSSREPNQYFDSFEPEDGPVEIFADGFAGLSFTATIARVDLYTHSGVKTEDGQDIEQRLTKHRVIMPIEHFLELCAKVLVGVKQNEEQMDRAFKELQEKIRAYLPDLGGTKSE